MISWIIMTDIMLGKGRGLEKLRKELEELKRGAKKDRCAKRNIIYRHTMMEIDECQSTESLLEIITEHFFVISNDENHDKYYVNHAQKLFKQYLNSIDYKCSQMHEFTDGCGVQYKSRNCLGIIYKTCDDLDYDVFMQNYFETSDIKGQMTKLKLRNSRKLVQHSGCHLSLQWLRYMKIWWG